MKFKSDLKLYRHSDLEPLTGAIRALDSIDGLPCIEIRHAGEAFTQMSSAEDVPTPLRRYYAKVGKRLTDTEIRMKKYLRSAKSEGEKLSSRINKALGLTELTEEELNRLHHVNMRLQELEKILQQKIDGMHERLAGFNPLQQRFQAMLFP